MSKRNDGQARGKYPLEFKLEAVRLIKGGQAVPVTARILGVPAQTLILPLFSGLLKPPIMRTSCLAAGPLSSAAQTSLD